MSDQRTTPHIRAAMPVRSLRVEVTRGPDMGKSHVADSDVLTVGSAPNNDLVLGDSTVSRYHLELRRDARGIMVIDCGSSNGTTIGSVGVERGVVAPGTIIGIGASEIRVGDGDDIEIDLHGESSLAGIRGGSPVMRRLMAKVQRVASSDVPVLLQGESGTGKELFAEAIHQLSPRSRAPFVTVDCASLTPTLVASELFGHEKGAFTGADRRHEGAFERANGGTIFLDELGELPPSLQTHLLGVLERRRFRRLGGKDDITTDVRLLAATHRDLRAEVNRGDFRLDLYYRVAVLMLEIPALRERSEDVPLLIEHFLRESGHTGPVEELISAKAMAVLGKHHWPGNVRELRNLVEATMAMGEPPTLHNIPSQSASAPPPSSLVDAVLELSYKDARRAVLSEFESRYLKHLLDSCQGNVSKASRHAKMDRSHLNDLLRRHGLK